MGFVERMTDSEKCRTRIAYLTNSGKGCYDQGELDKCLKLYNDAYVESKRLTDLNFKQVCAFNLGLAYNAAKQHAKALDVLQECAKLTTKLQDKDIERDLYFNLGVAYEFTRDADQALVYFRKALDCCQNDTEMLVKCVEKCFEVQVTRSVTEELIVECDFAIDAYTKVGEIAKAITKQVYKASLLIEKNRDTGYTEAKSAQSAVEENANIAPHLAGGILNNLGLLMTQLKEYSEAMTCFEKALAQLEKVRKEDQDKFVQAIVHQNLGAVHTLQPKVSESDAKTCISHNKKAIRLLELGNHSSRGQSSMNIANAHVHLNQLPKAKKAFEDAVEAAKQSQDNVMVWQALEGLGDVCYNCGEYETAKEHFIHALQFAGDDKNDKKRITAKLGSLFKFMHDKSLGEEKSTLSEKQTASAPTVTPGPSGEAEQAMSNSDKEQ